MKGKLNEERERVMSYQKPPKINMLHEIDEDYMNSIIDYYMENRPKAKYGVESIELLFRQFPENKNLETIFLKAAALNQIYSTRIFNVYELAVGIHNINNLDTIISDGDPELVEQVATNHNLKRKNNKGGKPIRFYSFATKYCHFHNPDEYPIYDTMVVKSLNNFNKLSGGKLNYTLESLRRFGSFKETICNFRKQVIAKEVTARKLDLFLWAYGQVFLKESF